MDEKPGMFDSYFMVMVFILAMVCFVVGAFDLLSGSGWWFVWMICGALLMRWIHDQR